MSHDIIDEKSEISPVRNTRMGQGRYDEIGGNAVGEAPINQAHFTLGFIGAQVIGIIMVGLSGVWMGQYAGGFGWGVSTVFNYHPLFMTIGMLFLYGNCTVC